MVNLAGITSTDVLAALSLLPANLNRDFEVRMFQRVEEGMLSAAKS